MISILVCFCLSLSTLFSSLISVFSTDFLCSRLDSFFILLSECLMVLAPGVMPHIPITSAKLPAPVLKTPMVSQTAMRTRLAQQNLIFGHRDHKMPFAASFWFWVIPLRHLLSSSSLESLVNIGSSSFIKTSGNRLPWLYVFVFSNLSFQYLHHVSLDLGQCWCCLSKESLLFLIVWLWIAFMLCFIPAKFPLFPLIALP